MSRVVLGVGGGIAAYKAADLLRRLTEAGHDVTVAPTAAALRFVGEPTWAALSHHPVRTDVWTDVHAVPGRRGDGGAAVPAERGPEERRVGANDDLPHPAGVDVVRVVSAADLR